MVADLEIHTELSTIRSISTLKKIHACSSACLIFFSIVEAASAEMLDFNPASLGVLGSLPYDSVSLSVEGISVNITAYVIEHNDIGTIASMSQIIGSNVGVYVSDSNNLGVISSPLDNADSHGMDGGNSGDTSDPSEGLRFFFDQYVNLDYINFDDFGGANDFNLTVDGVSTLVDFRASSSSPLVDGVPGQFDEYSFLNMTGQEFLFWADADTDDFRIDTMNVSLATNISISFSGTTTVTEGQGQLQVSAMLIRDEMNTSAVELSYNTEVTMSGQTAATANADYQNTSGSLSWLPNESGSKTFIVIINDDMEKEGVEDFDILINTLTGNVNIDSLSGSARYTISIQDNDVISVGNKAIGTPEQSLAKNFNVFCAALKDTDVSADTTEGQLLDLCDGFAIASAEETDIALRKISPEEVSSMSRIIQQMLRQQLSNISLRVKSLRQGFKGSSFNRLSLKVNGQFIPTWALENIGKDIFGIKDSQLDSLIGGPMEWFISGNYSFGSYGETANESGFRPRQYGVSTGVDYRYKPNIIGGIAIGLSGTKAEMNGQNGSVKSKGYDLLAFATYFYQQTYYFDAVISSGSYSFDSTRNINFRLADRETNKTAVGATSSQQLGLNLGAGYNKAFINGLTLGSNLSLSYTIGNIDDFQEQGANELNLSIDKQKISTAQTQIGFSLSKVFNHQYGVFLPQAGATWVHEFADDIKTISGRFISTTESMKFSFKSDAPDRDYIIANAGLSWVMQNGKSAFINYQTLFARENYTNHQFSLGLRMENLF